MINSNQTLRGFFGIWGCMHAWLWKLELSSTSTQTRGQRNLYDLPKGSIISARKTPKIGFKDLLELCDSPMCWYKMLHMIQIPFCILLLRWLFLNIAGNFNNFHCALQSIFNVKNNNTTVKHGSCIYSTNNQQSLSEGEKIAKRQRCRLTNQCFFNEIKLFILTLYVGW